MPARPDARDLCRGDSIADRERARARAQLTLIADALENADAAYFDPETQQISLRWDMVARRRHRWFGRLLGRW
jgi:hypothetical protein